MDYALYFKFLNFIHRKSSRNRLALVFDSIISSFKYNISLLEYFNFEFFNKKNNIRSQYAGTGYMYEYQVIMNPKQYRKNFEDKREFLNKFSKFIIHKHYLLKDFKNMLDNQELAKKLPKKILLKRHDGQCGKGIEIIDTTKLSLKALKKKLQSTKNDMVEEYIEQHSKLKELSPSGLNTIRIYSQVNSSGVVDILACRLRISVNSIVDNLAAGNLVASIDSNTGIVNSNGFYSDITKPEMIKHPITDMSINGFEIPHWDKTISMVKDAALHYPYCKSIGWDIAITENGLGLIEGNHDWCKLVWQLPAKKGLKLELERYLKK